MFEPLCIYAVVPAEEALVLSTRAHDIGLASFGPIAAVFGGTSVEECDIEEEALNHDSVVRLAMESCSSVIPFRLGIELQTEEEVRRILEVNVRTLADHLRRFRGKVEMGLRAILTAPKNTTFAEPTRLPFGLDRIRALAPLKEDRKESPRKEPNRVVFESCYLISRQAVDFFWAALDDIRSRVPDMPLLGSGPWAPYGFCDFVLGCAAGDGESVEPAEVMYGK